MHNVFGLGEGYELNKMIMEYEGKLYGKLGFKQYFDTGKTSKDWDSMERKIAELNEELSKLRQDAVSGTLPTYNICGGCGADNPSKRCIGCRHVFGNGH